MKALVSVAVLALVAFNLIVTVRAFRADFLSRNQKVAQIFLVWLVPLLGAISISMFLRAHEKTSRSGSGYVPNENDYPGVNLYPPHGPSDP
jgi:hypothetical protein